MKATLIRYNAKGLNKSDSSKISKGLMGYTDKSNNGRYTYRRKGLVTSMENIIISRSTFIVPRNKTKEIVSYIKSKSGNVSSWIIDIPSKYFKN